MPRQPEKRDTNFYRVYHSLPDGLVRAGSWGMADQAIISGTNFATSIVAARVLGPATFGVFAILLTVLWMMESTQRALITTPHNVLGVNREGQAYRTYTSSALGLQFAMALVFACTAGLAGVVMINFNREMGLMVLAMGLAAFAWQGQEFTRRVLYTELRLPAAVVCDASTYLLRLLLVAVLVAAGLFSGTSLLLLLAATWAIGAVVGFWSIRKSLVWAFDYRTAYEHWAFGRWLFASNAVSYLPRYVVAAILSSGLSVAAYGAYRAFEQLANGANVPLTAMSNVLRPRMARESRNGPGAVWQIMRPVMLLGSVVLSMFALGLIILRQPLTERIYGTEYLEFTAAVFLVALIPLVTLHKSMLIKAMQAFHNTRAIFVGTVAGGLGGSVAGSALIFLAGLPAAGAAVLLSTIVSTAWLGWVWTRLLSTGETAWTEDIEREPEIVRPS